MNQTIQLSTRMQLTSEKNSHDLTCHSYVPLRVLADEFFFESVPCRILVSLLTKAYRLKPTI